MKRIETLFNVIRVNVSKRFVRATLACIAAAVAWAPAAYAQSVTQTASDATRSQTTLVSYADASPGYAMPTRVDAGQSAAPMSKDAVRAQVVGQLRQTVHDSELAGLRDIYTHP
ncbi:exported protein of unknown function [Pararobbsia alpina]